MTFTLHVDADDLARAPARRLADETPGLVPVAKGNGYGFGNARLGAESGGLGSPVLAVGTRNEVAEATRTPSTATCSCSPRGTPRPTRCRRPTTRRSVRWLGQSRPSPRSRLRPRHRVVVEVATSMHRHGVEHDRLPSSRRSLHGVTSRVSPSTSRSRRPRSGGRPRPRRSVARLWGAGLRLDRLWVSHLSTRS